MFRLASTLCPQCQAWVSTQAPSIRWQSHRGAATLQKRKPSRMALSPSVSTGPRAPSNRRTSKRKQYGDSPFGGMNVTSVPRHLEAARTRDAASKQERAGSKSRSGMKKTTRRSMPDSMKAMKMQRALANVSYEKRGRIKSDIAERDSFDDFNLLPVISESIAKQALNDLPHVKPTPIQRLAIPALLGVNRRRGKKAKSGDTATKKEEMLQFLLAAETGSGKTLAYVLPTIDAIKRSEIAESAQQARQEAKEDSQRLGKKQLFELASPSVEEADGATARPRAIILVPTAELVEQVGQLVKSLGHTVKYRSALVSANYSGKVIRSRLFTTSGIDLVVCTPHLLNSITESDPNILSRVSHLIIDEADSLFDRSFAPITSNIIDRATPSLHQLVLCSATIPRNLDFYLKKRYPDIQRLVTPNLHAIPRRVQLSVVDIEKVPYQGNRDLACAQSIWDIGRDRDSSDLENEASRETKVVVFVNEREKSVELAGYLRSKGVDAMALSRDSDERKQAEVLDLFTGSSPSKPPAASISPATDAHIDVDSSMAISPSDLAVAPKQAAASIQRAPRQLPNTKVLVMTDLGSRGIDTLPVRHVVLYDVPHTSIDFIHRLGRVGRMGRRGRGLVLVGKNDRRDIVREIREGMFKGQALI